MWSTIIKYIEPALSWVFILSIGGWVLYAGLIRPVIHPNPTTTQNGGISYNYDIKVGALSCARIPSPQEQLVTTVKPIADKVKKVVK